MASRACYSRVGVHRLAKQSLGPGLQPLRKLVEQVPQLVAPVTRVPGLRPDVGDGGPETKRAIADRDQRSPHAAPLQLT